MMVNKWVLIWEHEVPGECLVLTTGQRFSGSKRGGLRGGEVWSKRIHRSADVWCVGMSVAPDVFLSVRGVWMRALVPRMRHVLKKAHMDGTRRVVVANEMFSSHLLIYAHRSTHAHKYRLACLLICGPSCGRETQFAAACDSAWNEQDLSDYRSLYREESLFSLILLLPFSYSFSVSLLLVFAFDSCWEERVRN